MAPTPVTQKAAQATQQGWTHFKRRWLSDPSTYPVIGVMVVASALAAGYIGRLALHPSARWTPKLRGADLSDDAEYGGKYHDHIIRKTFTGGNPRVMANFQDWLSGSRRHRYDEDDE